MKLRFSPFASSLLIAMSASAAFAAEVTMSGDINVIYSLGLPKSLPVKVSASIVPGEIQEIKWWSFSSCVEGYGRDGDCRGISEFYWTPAVKVAIESAQFNVEIGGHQFHLDYGKDYAFIRPECIENEHALRVHGTIVEPKKIPEKIVVKKDCGIAVQASQFARLEDFLGQKGVSTLTKTVLTLNVVSATSESLVIENGGVNNRRAFAKGNERILIPSHVSWVNLGPVYSKVAGMKLSYDNFQTYLEELPSSPVVR